jgi:threonine dehydrogenase-like Zn-dependent dehydrogenase
MKGLWLENNQLQLKTDILIAEPPLGEALARVLRTGICNTDLELLRGYYPYKDILAHEFVGVVKKGSEQLINKRVVSEINAVCSYCQFCRSGKTTHCGNLILLGICQPQCCFC